MTFSASTVLLAAAAYLLAFYGVAWLTDKGKVEFDYRPVHLNTLSNEVQPVPPKARVY